MERAYLEIIFLCGIILQIMLLWPHIQNIIVNKPRYYFNKKERRYLIFAGIDFLFLPLIYVFSTWFSWFDYTLPRWLGFPITFLYCFTIWLFYRSYLAFGSNWSPGLEIREGHVLILTGVFKWVRHPMYAAFVATAVLQIFMLQNWFVGPAFLILAAPLYFYRVKREEQQLIRHFGEAYRSYQKQTNALIPKMEQIDLRKIYNKVQFLRKNKG
jgi:protein-S-isoprenylcysteine O-methyltransferase Ste14